MALVKMRKMLKVWFFRKLSENFSWFFLFSNILDEGEEIEDEEYDLPYGEEEIDGEDEEEGKWFIN